MRVFITGATGYIGSAIAETLRPQYSLIGLARSDEAAAVLQQNNIDVQRGDLQDPSSLVEGLHDADAVIHTAASRASLALQWERAAVIAMLDALAGTDKTFIYTSGASIVGDTGEHVVDETEPLDTSNPRAELEQIVLSYADKRMRPIIIRPAFVYGRAGGILPRFINHAKQHGIAGYVLPGTNLWSFIHVDDLARLYQRALEYAPDTGIYNGSNNSPLAMRAVSEHIARTTGAVLTPWTAAEAVPIIGGIAHLLSISVAVSSKKAKRELGWTGQARSLFDDIADT